MPRDGSGIYSYPVGTPGIPDQTIESARYNNFLNDIEKDQNDPRPILTGGTGADNAVTAMVNLSGEIAKQLVTNYDLHPFQSGSFYSATTASGGPVASHAFSGICYKVDDGNMVLEARDGSDTQVPGRPYIREKKAGIWSAWVSDNYVTKNGASTTEGPLTIDPPGAVDAALILNADAANQNLIYGQKTSKNRWVMVLGNGTAEVDPQTGSDFALYRYKNDGVFIDAPLFISRATGLLQIKGPPVAAADAANKAYVDAREAAEVTRANAAYQAKDPQLFAGIPNNHIGADGYWTIASDAQKMLVNTLGGTAITIVINGGLYPLGTCISFFAWQQYISVVNTETMFWRSPAGAAVTGNRTLGQFGVCTAQKWTGGNWCISGNGLT